MVYEDFLLQLGLTVFCVLSMFTLLALLSHVTDPETKNLNTLATFLCALTAGKLTCQVYDMCPI